jgi:hypothetical protein
MHSVFYLAPYRSNCSAFQRESLSSKSYWLTEITYNYHHAGSYYSMSMWLTIITIQISYYSMSMWLTIITIQISYYSMSMWLTIVTNCVHNTVQICDLRLSPYRFILQDICMISNYHHTSSYCSTSMWPTIITI